MPYKNYTKCGNKYGTVEELEYRLKCEDNNIEWTFNE